MLNSGITRRLLHLPFSCGLSIYMEASPKISSNGHFSGKGPRGPKGLGLTILWIASIVLSIPSFTSPIFEFPDTRGEIFNDNFEQIWLISFSLVFVISLSYLLISVFRRNLKNTIIVVVPFLFLFTVTYYNNLIWPFLWKLNYINNKDHFLSCAAQSFIVQKSYRLGICDMYPMADGDYYQIVFDSTGEIANPYGIHSKEWMQVVNMMSKTDSRISSSFKAQPLGYGFYRINPLMPNNISEQGYLTFKNENPLIKGDK